jgi:hypothetical protein
MLLAAGPIDSELTIGASIYDYHWNPSIAMDHDGDYVIAWATGQRMGDTQIYAQRFNAVGVPQTAPLQLTDKPAIRPFWSDSIHLSAAMDDQHNFVVTWDDRTDDPRWADIYACHYDAATHPFQGPDESALR